MKFMYFTERPYDAVPEDEVLKQASFFGVPNKYFDPVKGSKYLNQYLDEDVFAEEVGFDAVMLNEHHGNPFCLGAVMDVEAAILARITKKIKIVLLGNPLPIVANPLRLAEELAMIDLISGGRLVTGWVRGAGSEQLANNANPAHNREYFNEAHDLVIQAWTRDGPFRFEGKHFHYRFANPWVKPLQKPHPQIWIPGLISPETVVWSAQHRYPYLALSTPFESTLEMWNIYGKAAAAEGYQVGPENFGYLQKVFVAETDEKAQELGRIDLYGGGIANFARGEWMFPPGYNSKEATRRLAAQAAIGGAGGIGMSPDEYIDPVKARAALGTRYRDLQDTHQLVVGSPKTVTAKLKKVLEVLRPGVLACWQNDGPVGAENRKTSIRLLGQEVLPELREYGNKLGLTDPYERKPGSRALPASGQPEALSALSS